MVLSFSSQENDDKDLFLFPTPGLLPLFRASVDGYPHVAALNLTKHPGHFLSRDFFFSRERLFVSRFLILLSDRYFSFPPLSCVGSFPIIRTATFFLFPTDSH